MSPQSAANKRLRSVFRKLLSWRNRRASSSRRRRESFDATPVSFEQLEPRTLLSGTLEINPVDNQLLYIHGANLGGTPDGILTITVSGGNYIFAEATGEAIVIGPNATLAGWTGSGTATATGPTGVGPINPLDPAVNSIVVNMAAGNDTVVINSLADADLTITAGIGDDSVALVDISGRAVVINADAGNDRLVIGSVSTPNGINGTVIANGGDNNDTFDIHVLTGTLTANGDANVDTFNVFGMASNATLNGLLGNDVFNIMGMADTSAVTLSGGDDNDQFSLGAPLPTVDGVGSIDNLLGTTAIDGGNGTDFVFLEDDGDSDAVNYSVTLSNIVRGGAGSISYAFATVESITIDATQGNNNINAGPGTLPALALRGFGGTNTAVVSGVTINNFIPGELSSALYLESFNTAQVLTCNFNSGSANGVLVDGVTTLTMTGVQASNNLLRGVWLDSVGSATLTNVEADGNGDIPLSIFRSGLQADTVTGTLTIALSSFDNNTDRGLLVTDGHLVVGNSTAMGNTAQGLFYNGDGAGDVTASFSNFSNNGSAGIDIRRVRDVVLNTDTSTNNPTGAVVNASPSLNARSVQITEGDYSNNSTNGIFIQDVTNNVTVLGADSSDNGIPGEAPSLPALGSGVVLDDIGGNVTIGAGDFSRSTDHALAISDIGGNVTIFTAVATDSGDRAGVNFSFAHGLRATNITGDLAITDSNFSRSTDHGINILTVGGNVTISNAPSDDNGMVNTDPAVQSIGLRIQDVNGNVSVTDGSYSRNTLHGVFLFDIEGDVTFDNAPGSDNGQGNAVRALPQAFGFFGDDILGDVTVANAAYSRNTLDGVFLTDVTGNVSLSGSDADDNGVFNSEGPNGEDNTPVRLRVEGLHAERVGGSVFVEDGSFSRNMRHGIGLTDIGGSVGVARVTADDNNDFGGTLGPDTLSPHADDPGVGDGLSLRDSDSLAGGDGDTLAVGGNVSVMGGSFSDFTNDMGANGFNSVQRQVNGIYIQSVSPTSDIFISGDTDDPISARNNAGHGLLIEQGGANATVTGTDDPDNAVFSGNGFFDDLNTNPPPLPAPQVNNFADDRYTGNGITIFNEDVPAAFMFSDTVELSFVTASGNLRRGFEIRNIGDSTPGSNGTVRISDIRLSGNQEVERDNTTFDDSVASVAAQDRGGTVENADLIHFISTSIPDDTPDNVHLLEEEDVFENPIFLLEYNGQQEFSYYTTPELLVETRGAADVVTVDSVNLTDLTIFLGTGNDTLNLNASASGTTTAFGGSLGQDPGDSLIADGDDTFNIDAGNLSGNNDLFGQNDGDTFNVNFTVDASISAPLTTSGGPNNLAAPFGNRDRLYLNDLTPGGLTLGMTFTYLGGDMLSVTGLAAPLTTTEIETVGLRGTGPADSATVVGAEGVDDLLTIVPISGSRALVFNNGNPFQNTSDDFAESIPGISGGASGPDLDLDGLDTTLGLTIRDDVASLVGEAGNDRVIVYAESENDLTDNLTVPPTGTFDVFGFGPGVLMPGGGEGNAYDVISVTDSKVNISGRVHVNINPDDFVQTDPNLPGLIVNGGNEVGVDINGLADQFTATNSLFFRIQINGGDPPLVDEVEEGDSLSIAIAGNSVNISSDANSPPSVAIDAGAVANDFPISFSSIEVIAPFQVQIVNLLGDNNNPLADQDDFFLVRAEDVDSPFVGGDVVNESNEMKLRISGNAGVPGSLSQALRFYGTQFLNVFGYEGADVLDLGPYADNTPAGWGIAVNYDGGDVTTADDVLIYNNVEGVSENTTITGSNIQAGQVAVTIANTGQAVVLINYTNTSNLVFNGNNLALPETDSLFLRGTDGVTSGTSGHDRMFINYDAAGTLNDPFLEATDIPTGGILYRIQSVTNYDVLSLDLLVGDDRVEIDRTVAGVNPDLADIRFAQITGNLGNDSLDASGNTDAAFGVTMLGGDGNDTLVGGAGGDRLESEAGNDSISGGGGVDSIFGGNEDDTIRHAVGDGNDNINAGAGTNTLRLIGTTGNDTISLDPSGGTLVVTNHLGETLLINLITNVLIEPLAGADVVNLADISSTGVSQVDVSLGGADAALDTVNVSGSALGDAIVVTSSGGLVSVAGAPVPVRVTNSAVAEDKLVILGLGGADSISAAGNQNLIGLVFSGGDGNDTLTGGIGSDSLIGGLNDDLFVVSAGNDTMNGDAGTDAIRLLGDNLNNTFTLSQSGALITLAGFVAGTIELVGAFDHFEVLALADHDTVTITGFTVSPSVLGGDGDDTVTIGGSEIIPTVLRGEAGNDSLTGGAGSDSLDGGTGNDVLNGRGGIDTALGGDGDDTIRHTLGDGSDALLDGQVGGDLLDLIGTTGDDSYTLIPGSVRVQASLGTDFTALNVEFASIFSLGGADNITIGDMTSSGLLSAVINLGSDGVADLVTAHGGIGGETIGVFAPTVNVVNITGLPVPLIQITGSSNPSDVLTVLGNDGGDTMSATGADAYIGVALNGGNGNDSLTGDTSLFGGANNDTLVGGTGNNFLDGGTGDDSVSGGAGNDTVLASPGSDTLSGGTQNPGGLDILRVLGDEAVNSFTISESQGTPGVIAINADTSNIPADDFERLDVIARGEADNVVVTLHSVEYFVDGGDAGDTTVLDGADIINASGSTANGTILGGAGGDIITAGSGNDSVDGGSGNDSVAGGPGADSVLGGSGNDTIIYAVGDGADSIAEGGTGTNALLLIGTAAPDTFTLSAVGAQLRVVTQNVTDNFLASNINNVFVRSLAGADTITVGDLTGTTVTSADFDLGSADGAADSVTFSGRATADTVTVGAIAATVNVVGLPVTAVLRNTSVTDDVLTVLGLGGNDSLNETGGATLIGVVLDGGAGNDTLTGNTTLLGGDGQDSLEGGTGNNFLDGGADSDVVHGNNGDDTILASTGNDTISGGFGLADVYRLLGDANPNNLGMVESSSGTPTLTVTIGASIGAVNIAGAGIESVDVLGLGGNDTITLGLRTIAILADGGDGQDIVNASASIVSGTLVGGEGNDSILGSSASDSLTGGDGDDTLAGNLGNDALAAGNDNDLIRHTVGDGSDANDAGSGANTLLLVGNSSANSFTLAASGASATALNNLAELVTAENITTLVVQAQGGADTITINDLTSAGTTLVDVDLGLSDAAADQVVVNGLSGNDSITVGQAASIVSVTGLFATTSIRSGAATDTLSVFGLDGDDTLNSVGPSSIVGVLLDGGEGADYVLGNSTLVGGIGNDFIQGGTGNSLLLGGLGDDTLDAGGGSDTLDGGDGNDSLLGGDGTDRLLGGNDDDTLAGGAGNDTVDGGAGDDSIINDAGNDSLNGGTGTDVLFIRGTGGNDIITFNQTLATSLLVAINGVNQFHALTPATIEKTAIDASSGDDQITVVTEHDLHAAPTNDALEVVVDGGLGTDTLTVVDEGPGDANAHTINVDGVSGNFIVGNPPSQPEPFFIDYFSIENFVANTSGVIFDDDPFDNDNQNNNTQDDAVEINLNNDQAVVDAAIDSTNDEDWFEVCPEKGGNLIVELEYLPLATLPNFGHLGLELYDENGNKIQFGFSSETGNLTKRIIIPAVLGTCTFVRVFGLTGGINNYQLRIFNNQVADVGFGLFSPFAGTNAAQSPPVAVAAGDVNGDGLADLVTANAKAGSVSVMLGNPLAPGTFLPANHFSVFAKNPVAVALGDVNGDGRLDIATANSKSGNVSVLLNNGGGQFVFGGNFAVGKGPTDIELTDANGDGDADIITANSGAGTIGILIGDDVSGGAGFNLPISISTGGKKPTSLALGDVNSDGRVDIVAANSGSANVAVFFGSPNGFNNRFLFATGAAPTSVIIGDFNTDGFKDIVTSNAKGTGVSFLINNQNNPLLSLFTLHRTINFNVKTDRAIALGADDLDLDGDLDLILGTVKGNKLRTLLNHGDASFDAPLDLFIGNPVFGKPTFAVVQDFNRDGLSDLAFTNFKSNNVTVLQKLLT